VYDVNGDLKILLNGFSFGVLLWLILVGVPLVALIIFERN